MSDETTGKVPFREAMGLLRKTTPFLFANVVVYGGFFLATVLWMALWGALAVFFAERVELLAIICFIIAVAVPGGLLVLGKRYVLYLVQGAHIAVATKLLLEGELPQGKGQVEYGREVVKDNFRDVSILFAVDRIVDRVVRAFVRSFVRIVDILPLGGAVSQIARIVGQVVRRAASYIDNAILSYAIALNEDNVWRSARHGLILYAQVYKPVLATAAKVWVLGRVFFVVALVAVGVPLFFGAAVFFDAFVVQLIALVATFLLAHLLVRAFFEPFAMIYTLATYHRAIEGVEINATWDRRLQDTSKAFRDLVGRAREHDDTTDPVDADASEGTGAEGSAGDTGRASRGGAASRQAGVGGGLGGLLGQAASAAGDALGQRNGGNGPAPAGPTGEAAPTGDTGEAAPAGDTGSAGDAPVADEDARGGTS
ncbi:collagen-like protein [Egibacter rhizosphaerae]|uniref:Collagen-like protein n=1 Tax=Egibacter rhizosphaerae TaxID=1670831 RepID=A0A411YFW2_9ACTN|nr:collagen-like protein [Egibacter rhizosphaerae]QBI20155.1 collagen-like protein [Egibacter rhizosphaerae]